MATLSMGAGALAGVGAALAVATPEDCRERVACAAPDPAAVRRAVADLSTNPAG